MAKIKNAQRQLAVAKGYAGLVKQIQVELSGLESFIKQQTVKTYWNIGRYISEHILENQQRADYGDHLYERLGRDLSVSDRTLKRTVQFYRDYPIRTNLSELGWSHFLYLLTVQDKKARELLERQAVRENWKISDLKMRIDAFRLKEAQSREPGDLPQLKRSAGKLHTYKIIESEAGLFIDLGFQMRKEFPEAKKYSLEKGDRIEVKEKGYSWDIKKASIPEEELFTYIAYVENIIDGDTLWALIDCGFGMFIRQKLRLRGIDCPEIGTEEGQESKSFVQRRLNNLDFVVIKTYKDSFDKYDRYLADIFYPPLNLRRAGLPLKSGQVGSNDKADPYKVSEQGNYLNQELLDERLAYVW
mgnify:CR=1 FL=1